MQTRNQRILAIFLPYWKRFVPTAVAIVLTACLGLVQPYLLRTLIDRAIPSKNLHWIGWLCGAMFVTTLTSAIVDTLQTYNTVSLGQTVLSDLRMKIYAHLQKQSLRFFGDTRSGEILTRVTSDVSAVHEAVTGTAASGFKNTLVVFSTLGMMFYLDWKLTLASLVLLPGFVLPTRLASRSGKKNSKELQARIADLNAHLGETLSLSGALLSKTSGSWQREQTHFQSLSDRVRALELRRSMIGHVYWTAVQSFSAVAPAVLYFFGGRAVSAGTMTVGSIVAFVALQSRLLFPVGQLFGLHVQLQTAAGVFDRIFEYLDLPVEIAEQPNAKPLQVTEGRVEFEDVSFAYGTSQAALSHVNLVAEPGVMTALVGPSGAGKTTTAYLVARLYDPSSGRVCIDGTDLRTVTLDSLANAVGIVTQDAVVLYASVKENIRYARPDASDEDVIRAARAAALHERIEALPKGYDTLVGERGFKLSGGERQRLSIARVMLKNAPIVILDEATSALDSVSEQKVQQALQTLSKGRTTIAIAHRLSTVRSAHTILVMDKGAIVEKGTHGMLYARGGMYRTLVDGQWLGSDELDSHRVSA